jgi:hypothetical protein
VLNCLSLKAYTVVMVNHERLPWAMWIRSARQGATSLFRFGLSAHLAKEGVKRFSGDQDDLSTNGTYQAG